MMILSKTLRYISLILLIYFSMRGVEFSIIENFSISGFEVIFLYILLSILPVWTLFFGFGASDVDMPNRKQARNST